MPYLTPDAPPEGEFFCRVFRVPKDPQFLSLFDGAITELCKAANYEQFGDLTPEETAELFLASWVEMMDAGNVCMQEPQIDVWTHELAQGTAGGGLTANVEAIVTFNVAGANNAGNVTQSGGVFSLVPGRYLIDIWHIARAASAVNQICYLRNNGTSTPIQEGLHLNQPANVQGILRVSGEFIRSGSVGLLYCIQQSVTRATDALGVAANVAGHTEVYGQAVFTRLGD